MTKASESGFGVESKPGRDMSVGSGLGVKVPKDMVALESQRHLHEQNAIVFLGLSRTVLFHLNLSFAITVTILPV